MSCEESVMRHSFFQNWIEILALLAFYHWSLDFLPKAPVYHCELKREALRAEGMKSWHWLTQGFNTKSARHNFILTAELAPWRISAEPVIETQLQITSPEKLTVCFHEKAKQLEKDGVYSLVWWWGRVLYLRTPPMAWVQGGCVVLLHTLIHTQVACFRIADLKYTKKESDLIHKIWIFPK